VDVRVIAATHRNLEAMIREGKFREDLFHRLNVVCLQLPPLRERREDIPLLVQHFLRKYAGDFGVESPTISSDAVAVLQADSWPGNVRELENMTRRLLLAARGLSINADAVRQTLAARNAEAAPTGHSFTAFAGDLLARAQKGELQDAHARMLAEAEREILDASHHAWRKAIKRKPRAGWGCPDSPCAKNSSSLACIPERKMTRLNEIFGNKQIH
jgi:DNA-binding NtrC family response regulator